MRGMGAGMRRARLGRERREWRCHPHLREETRPERGWAPRLGGARGTAGGHRTGHGGDTQEPRGPLGASRLSRPHGPDSDLRISRSPPAPRTPGWRRILAVPPPPPAENRPLRRGGARLAALLEYADGSRKGCSLPRGCYGGHSLREQEAGTPGSVPRSATAFPRQPSPTLAFRLFPCPLRSAELSLLRLQERGDPPWALL